MDTAGEIEAMADHFGRVAGTDAERRAAVHLRKRLEDMGRDAELQTLQIRPRFAAAHAIHAAIAVVGSVVAINSPTTGSALVAIAVALTFLDVAGVLQVVRRVTGTRASQNIESRESADKPGVVVLSAGYDVGRQGRALAMATRAVRNPWLTMLAAMGTILACCMLRLAGVEGTALTAVQFVPTLLLVVAIAVLADYELSRPATEPGRDAAVVTALRLAKDVNSRLDHFQLWVVLTGAERPFALGMAAWLKRRKKDLDPEDTAVISLGPMYAGPMRFTRREGALVPLRVHSRLARLCEEIAQDQGDLGVGRALARPSREPSDAAQAITRGLPAVTLACRGREGSDQPIDPDACELAYGFCRELILRLDAEVGPELDGPERRATSAGV